MRRLVLLLGAAWAAQQCTQRCRNECNACILSYAIIGARKAGTTSLYRWISAHPDAVGYGLNRGPRAGEARSMASRLAEQRATSLDALVAAELQREVQRGGIQSEPAVGALAEL